MSLLVTDDSAKPRAASVMIERRQFLVLGATALVGLAAASLPTNAFAAATGSGEGTPLSVGFVDYVPGSGKSMSRSGLISATAAAPSSDFSSASARLTVRGVWRRPASMATPVALRLLAYYPTEAGPTPLVLWTFESNGGKVGAAVSHAVVPMKDNAIELALITSSPSLQNFSAPPSTLKRVVAGSIAEVVPTHDELAARGSLVSLGTSSSTPNKLAWGTYFIAFADGAGSPAADWKSVRVSDLSTAAATDTRRAGPLSLSSFTGSSPVDFSYVMISVEPQPVETYRRRAR
jgi:hypothetical protein